jgi:hypothetical protein
MLTPRSIPPLEDPVFSTEDALLEEFATIHYIDWVRDRDPSETREWLRAHHDELCASPKTALCLSGGGIRSAAFCLGALQGLAKNGVLGEFN